LAATVIAAGCALRIRAVVSRADIKHGGIETWGMDAGFGRGTKGRDVASFMVRTLRERGSEAGRS
jgi:hypothetical protein